MSHFDSIRTPEDAILYCSFLGRFGTDETLCKQMNGVAEVIRDLCRRLEHQAVHLERAEAIRTWKEVGS